VPVVEVSIEAATDAVAEAVIAPAQDGVAGNVEFLAV
jgi:hypothetical protein